MRNPINKLLKTHQQLTHSEGLKVVSHLQRIQDDWYHNSLMLEGIDVPFKYKRKKTYQSLKGARVNVTYYPEQEILAGLSFEFMKVVRIKKS